MIREHLKLQFDPANPSEYPEVKQVFENRLARTLWLAIKPGHLTNQYLDENCLRAAKEIQKRLDKKKVLSPGMVQGILGGGSERTQLPADMELCTDLIPFLIGEREITYEICLKQTA